MKAKRLLPLLAALLAAVLSMGCPMADYVLDFHTVTASVSDADTVAVSYTLNNAGSKRLVDATVCIEVVAYGAGGGEIGRQEGWTWAASIDPGEYEMGSLSFAFYGLGESIASAQAYVVEAAWNEDDGGFIFPFD